MRDIVGYEGNKAIYADRGAAVVKGVSGITPKSKAKRTLETARLIERLERAKYPAAYLKKVIKNDLH